MDELSKLPNIYPLLHCNVYKKKNVGYFSVTKTHQT